MYERVIEAIAGRMIAAEEPGVRARDLRVAAGILNYIRMLPAPMQKDIHRLILLFEYLPPLVIFRPGRFSDLEPQRSGSLHRSVGHEPLRFATHGIPRA